MKRAAKTVKARTIVTSNLTRPGTKHGKDPLSTRLIFFLGEEHMIYPENTERTRIIERRIQYEVRKYYTAHGKGMMMQSLSAKYAVSTSSLGGFPEFIRAMEEQGLIKVTVSESAARQVYPPDAVALQDQPGPKAKKVWF